MEFGTAAATAPVAAYFRNPRRSSDVLSSAMGALRNRCNFRSRPELPFWHSGWRVSYTRPPMLTTGISKLPTPSTARSSRMGPNILRLVVGIRAPKGTPHDFSHPRDAYAHVVV